MGEEISFMQQYLTSWLDKKGLTFCFTGGNVDDRDSWVWTVFVQVLYGRGFADRGNIK